MQKVEEKPVETQPVVETPVATIKSEKLGLPETEVNVIPAQPVETQTAIQNDSVSEAIYLIKNTEVDKMNLALQRVNVALMKKHKIALSTEMSDDELRNVLSNKDIFSNPEQFLKTLKTLLGM